MYLFAVIVVSSHLHFNWILIEKKTGCKMKACMYGNRMPWSCKWIKSKRKKSENLYNSNDSFYLEWETAFAQNIPINSSIKVNVSSSSSSLFLRFISGGGGSGGGGGAAGAFDFYTAFSRLIQYHHRHRRHHQLNWVEPLLYGVRHHASWHWNTDWNMEKPRGDSSYHIQSKCIQMLHI